MKKAPGILFDYLMLIVGCFLFAIAWEGFMIPNGMSSGGLIGLCSVIQYATGGVLDVSLMYILLNALLLLFAFIAMGTSFGFRTIFCIAMSSVALKVVGSIDFLHAYPGSFFYVPEKVLVPVISGFFEAAGIGVIFRHGGSTGGTDIISLYINQHFPISPGKVYLVTDFIIITSILFLPGKTFSDMVYGYVMMVTFSIVVDMFTVGKKSSVQLLVFSQQYDKIADHIIYKLDRGVTVLKAQGWYTKKDKDVLLIIVSNNQLHNVTRAIKQIDPKAFVSVSQASSVYGEGFEEIKSGIDRKMKNKK